jgi:septum formation protein
LSDKTKLILASSSPRRREILKKLCLPFIVRKSKINELRNPNEDPKEYVLRIAHEKAYKIAKKDDSHVVIGADTIVVINGEVLGKPKDENSAKIMLNKLSGKKHKVLTGLCVLNLKNQKILKRVVESFVVIKELSLKEISNYVATGEPLDKAGSYAIQGIGAFLVREIYGSYSNVVGLPVCELIEMLLKIEAIKSFPYNSTDQEF